jgi:hypothetical protein
MFATIKNSQARLFGLVSKISNFTLLRIRNANWRLLKAETEMDRVVNLARRRLLSRQVSWGRNEIRRIEWSLREAVESCVKTVRTMERRSFISQHDSNSRSKQIDNAALDPMHESAVSAPSSIVREKALAAARKRALVEREKAQRKILINILDNAEAIATVEPVSSLPDALRPIANELRAHYNDIKKRSKAQQIALKTNTLADYWASWAAVSSLLNGTTLDGRIVKYASKDMRERIVRISKLVPPTIETREQDSRWLGFEAPHS